MSDLLPANATPQERAISDAIERAAGVPVVVREMWNPDTCPANLLPWLAWAFSVDTWDPNWSDAQKRGAIKASVEVHKRKGTIGALKTALASIGFEAVVQEWFETVPAGDPYTFGINLTVDQEGIPTVAAYNAIIELAMNAKNLRSHLTGVQVTGKTAATIYAGGVAISGETITIQGL